MSSDVALRWYWKDEWDFDTIPPDGPAHQLLQAILICAKGDGDLAGAERDWVVGLGAMHQVADDKLEALGSYGASDDLASTVEADPLVAEFGRRATAYFAIRASQADGDLDSGERATIEGMAAQAGLTGELVRSLFALVEAENKLKALRRVLLLPEGAPF
ncbi:MAG TPA: hypothetical protein VF244_09110 [Acidimicrobiales bacterium]